MNTTFGLGNSAANNTVGDKMLIIASQSVMRGVQLRVESMVIERSSFHAFDFLIWRAY
jgi:hypothetical protein